MCLLLSPFLVARLCSCSQSRVKVSAGLTDVGTLEVGAFDLVHCSQSVVEFFSVLYVGHRESLLGSRFGDYTDTHSRSHFSWKIALFTVSFSHLHYNVIQRGCEVISGYNYKIARNCLTYMLDFIVM